MAQPKARAASIEATVAALEAAARAQHLQPDFRDGMLNLATRLSSYSSVDSPEQNGALIADLQAADACLTMLRDIASLEDRRRAFEVEAKKKAMQAFLARRGRRYTWMLLVVSLFLATLIAANLILYYG